MNKYICQSCGKVSYSAAEPESLKNNKCPALECGGRLKMEEVMNTEEILKELKAEAGRRAGPDARLFGRAADLIESQAAEIERLNAEANGDYSEIADTLTALMVEVENVRAQLAASQARERAAVDLVRGQCFACRTHKTCQNRRGPHKHCWLYVVDECGPQKAGRGGAE